MSENINNKIQVFIQRNTKIDFKSAMARKIEDKEKNSFGNKLREVRETLGMSRNVFAREAKIDATHYERVEDGAVLPDYLFLKQLIHTFKISPYFLFDFQEGPAVEKSSLEEKRTFVRFFIQLKAHYSLQERDSVWEECTVLDVSRKGIGVEFSSQISLGSTINMTVCFPEELEPLSVKGMLKWIKQSGNRFIGDIELTELLDENTTLIMLRAGRSD